MKNETGTSMQLSKATIADLTQLQGGTVRSWSSLVLNAIKQETLRKAEMM
jgi:hypothetical protein